jgi:hypothetical protein
MFDLTTRVNALVRITTGNVNIAATTALQVGGGPGGSSTPSHLRHPSPAPFTRPPPPPPAGHRPHGPRDSIAARRQHPHAHLDAHAVP